ncbi:HET domain protein [Pyrenophora tritici-repentis]|uniref:HET domain containing protein pin-c1 n=1 Tax=Pyrenophora tritici-repentis TaxID=45151 RepID=A0A834RSU0_9PLEO|nr:HET domain containing protein pin-c1 [Pyrenophora tritici-repentis]KAI0586046.1 HET domain protein [Pyrenophora tritici-repentis]KAI0623398.1 HET domain protein [Pyrenophora tritici-repentis]KAI1681197.1 HET domain protein [Pyrenophora tritici-repentis]
MTLDYITRDSRQGPDGSLDHVVVRVELMHYVSEKVRNLRAFTIYTKSGKAFDRAVWSDNDPTDIKARSATIREWLTECKAHHSSCRKTLKSNTPLSARILAIQELGRDNYIVKLIPTDHIDLHNEPHLVLSHVWGGVEIACKTTGDKISLYQDIGINFAALPKTFQDAVRITAAIGFQYLWIDSLCIIQDDEEDWQRESAKMAAIFRAGTITLSATISENSHGGCGLTTTLAPAMRFRNISGRGPDFAAREIAAFGQSPTIVMKSELRHAPVNKRAWILQEKMLSQRILHAMESQFVWQCLGVTESEDGIAEVENQKGNGSIIAAWPDTDSTLQNTQLVGRHEINRRWWITVSDYSRRSLTKPIDRYAAMAGIVQLHQELYCDTSIVGLWENDLALHLSWDAYRPRNMTEALREPATRRPSWTWMSFQHGSVAIWPPIEWDDLRRKGQRVGDLGIVYQAQILQTNIIWSGRPLTSDPSGSTIRIRGIFLRMPRPKPVRAGVISPLHLDPGIPEEEGEYDTLALAAYVRSAALIHQSPFITTTYLVVKRTELYYQGGNQDEYMRIGRMELTESYNMNTHHVYQPRGVWKDIILV